MISGGDVLEWPPTEPEEMYKLEKKIDTMLTELFDKDYDEWLWDQDLVQGPPQDDDIVWLINKAWQVGWDECIGNMRHNEAEIKLAAL